MKIPQPTLNELHSKQPFHWFGKLGVNPTPMTSPRPKMRSGLLIGTIIRYKNIKL